MSETLVVVGGAAVGKSAMTLRFVRGEFVAVYEPTVEDAYRKSVDIEGRVGVVEIIDTAGTDQFRTMRDLYYKNSDGFLLVCSTDQASSTEEIIEIHEQITEVKGSQNIPIVVAINKSDIPKENWRIDVARINKLAKQWKVKVFLTSAKENENNEAAFLSLISRIRNQASLSSKKKKKGFCILV